MDNNIIEGMLKTSGAAASSNRSGSSSESSSREGYWQRKTVAELRYALERKYSIPMTTKRVAACNRKTAETKESKKEKSEVKQMRKRT